MRHASAELAAQSALCCLAESTLLCLSLVLSGVFKPASKHSLWPVSSVMTTWTCRLADYCITQYNQSGIRNDVHGGECCPKPTFNESVLDGRAAGPKKPRCISWVRVNSGSVRSPRLNKRADGEARPDTMKDPPQGVLQFVCGMTTILFPDPGYGCGVSTTSTAEPGTAFTSSCLRVTQPSHSPTGWLWMLRLVNPMQTKSDAS